VTSADGNGVDYADVVDCVAVEVSPTEVAFGEEVPRAMARGGSRASSTSTASFDSSASWLESPKRSKPTR
jgi:hypothetical protein